MAERIKSLKELREKHGYTLDKVAELLGLTTPSVWNWERQPAKWFKPRHIKMLSTIYPEDEVRQVLDPTWQPPQESDPEPAQATVEKPAIVVFPHWENQSPADVISELMSIMSKLTLNEMQAVLNTAKTILATKTIAAIGEAAKSEQKKP